MRYRRADVVDRAIGLLDRTGLEALSMRRLAAELGVQPAALYHHFADKSALLAAVADEILARGRRATEVVTWEAELRLVCVELRDAMVARRDAGRLIATVHALGTGAQEPERRMEAALRRAGADDRLARLGARLLLHFVLAHAGDPDEDFATGLAVLLDGLSARLAVTVG
ncbi:TetR family transcriptional regulator [Nocardioides sp. TF02-7]|uniref:TetR family transcriptional regulator n=1 Tax=Nocardioides sp. TF02-7 TaxID=2917724 RepID=UPI001F061837|nr:TetR family transcriptional regulator [Nocardioides sp. TF02-7]UMG93091.1 TetR family transcriptional regulator [Nocardioides sp. TF02-7]